MFPSVVLGAGLSIEQTSSYQIAMFFVLFVILSLVFEHFIHKLQHWLEHNNKTGLRLTLIKVKDELMLMGIFSLLLIAFENKIVSVCIPEIGMSIPTDLAVCKVSCATSTNTSRRLAGGGASACGRRRLAGSGDIVPCPAGQNHLIEANALHQVHLLLSVVTVFHVFATVFCLTFSKWRMNHWGGWDHWGDDEEEESPDKLKKPTNYGGGVISFCVNSILQFTKSVQPFTYVALKKYFIAKNREKLTKGLLDPWKKHGSHGHGGGHGSHHGGGHGSHHGHDQEDEHGDHSHGHGNSDSPHEIGDDIPTLEDGGQIVPKSFERSVDKFFPFHRHILNQLELDFAELAGIRSWMWLVLISQLLIEGYGLGPFLILNCIGSLTSFLIGAKLQKVAHELGSEMFAIFDKDGNGKLSPSEIEVLQSGKKEDCDALKKLTPHFWFGNPAFLKILMQFVLWQCSQSLSFMFFYKFVVGGEACYFRQRTENATLVFFLILNLFMLVHTGMYTLPLYSLVSHTGTEKKEGLFINPLDAVIGQTLNKIIALPVTAVRKTVINKPKAKKYQVNPEVP